MNWNYLSKRERSRTLKKQLGEEKYRAVKKLLRPSKKWKDVTGLYKTPRACKIYHTALCPECGACVPDGKPPTKKPR